MYTNLIKVKMTQGHSMPSLIKQKAPRLTNFMEELADNMLDELLSSHKTQRFSTVEKQDIKALALNRLWPMYTTSNTGRDFLKKVVVEDKIEQDIVRELRAAIDIVRSNPSSGQ